MKWTIALVVAGLLSFEKVLGGQAFAGPIQAAFVSGADFTNWVCGAPMPTPRPSKGASCGIAGFNECSRCPSVILTNHSGVHLNFHVDFGGPIQPAYRGMSVRVGLDCGSHPGWKPRSFGEILNCSDLDPGESCGVAMEFCPEQSGISYGSLRLIADDSGQTLATFRLSGNAVYTPELQAADQVRKRHLAELLKIAKVARVSLNPSDHRIVFDVEVEDSADIPQVRRAVPAKIEGYDVEVIEEDGTFWAN